ncbi:MAG: O-antigen ligase family protein, partial [Acidobacteriota bacterium]|nr:O-antigen ligase family protein [Acidobacteriota bacterium]
MIATSVLRLDAVPVPVALAILSIGLLALFRPDHGLLAVAAIVPVAAHMLRRWSPGVAWAETMVMAFAAGWYVRRVVRLDEPHLASRLRLPIIVFATVVCASAAVQMSVDYARLGSREFADFVLRYLSREYFVTGPDRYLQLAAVLLEGLLLFSAAARISSVDRRFARQLAGTLVLSAAAAAAINLQHLMISASRFDDFWRVLAQDVATARFSLHYADVNAAGSASALILFMAVALAIATRPARVLWAVPTALIGVGLWMSGSRTALLACPVAIGVLAMAALRTQMGRRGRLLTILLVVVLTGAALAVIYAPTRGNQQASSIAARVRIEMAETSIRMVRSSPIFGIGLGEFYRRSGEFSSPELLALFPPAHHENAHNNFLQVLAETGVIGLGAFLWLLVAAL